MSGVLEGLKVVSMEHMEAIPAATVWMADWGADVLKIEPLTGDMWRGTTRAAGTSTAIKLGGAQVRFTFHLQNRNKKSLAVDLKKGPGLEILYKLVRTADVFTSNYEVATLQKLKVDYATLRQLNPRLIYAVVSGYGSVGPDKDKGGFDTSAGWARSGLWYMTGEAGKAPPRPPGGTIDRGVAAPHILAGILGALYHREKTGEGQQLEGSLFRSAVWAVALPIQSALVGTPVAQGDRTKSVNPLHNNYRTKDDRWVELGMDRPDPLWPSFCQAIERPDLEKDPRFNDMETRTQNCTTLIRIIDEVLASKTMGEWEERFKKYNLLYSLIQTPAEVVNDPQALANDFFADLPHPSGTFKVVATPVKFYQNPASVRTAAPEIGQHTEEILLELGYSWEDISQLKEQGVIL